MFSYCEDPSRLFLVLNEKIPVLTSCLEEQTRIELLKINSDAFYSNIKNITHCM